MKPGNIGYIKSLAINQTSLLRMLKSEQKFKHWRLMHAFKIHEKWYNVQGATKHNSSFPNHQTNIGK